MSTADAADELAAMVKAKGKTKIVNVGSLRHSPSWINAFDVMLSVCESEDASPTSYLRCFVEVMGWWAEKNARTLQPNMLNGKGAVRRYNDWLKRNRSRGVVDGVVDLSSDRSFMAESLYCDIATRLSMDGKDVRKSIASARRVVNAKYHEHRGDKSRRPIALCNAIGSLHPDVPDMLVFADEACVSLVSVLTVTKKILKP